MFIHNKETTRPGCDRINYHKTIAITCSFDQSVYNAIRLVNMDMGIWWCV